MRCKGKPKRCPVCRLRHPRPWCRSRAADVIAALDAAAERIWRARLRIARL